ncbi:MAG TPA: MFS transporter [Thermodesulfobacteriota bacterium]|nr:MFS transporter [Thermodesulfobacteriota bacterium]
MTLRKIISREFLLCFSAQFAFTFVFHILVPTIPIYLSRSGSTEVEIGILIGALGISSLVLRPIVGKKLSEIREKKFMLAGAVLFAVTSVAYILTPPFWPFLFVRIFQGIGTAFFFTASIALITHITPEAYRGQSLGYFFLSFNISMALAPIAGMFLINQFSFDTLFSVCTVLSLCSLGIASRLSQKELNPVGDVPTEAVSSFGFKTLSPILLYFMVHMIFGALMAFFPLHAVNHGVANPGLFFTAYAFVMISGRVFGGRIFDIQRREKVILPCIIAFILAMTLLAFSKSLEMFILAAVIAAAGHAFLVPSLFAYVLDLVGASHGPAIGWLTAMGDLGLGLGPMIMGVVLRLTSFPTMFLSLALTGLIGLVYFYLFVRGRI